MELWNARYLSRITKNNVPVYPTGTGATLYNKDVLKLNQYLAPQKKRTLEQSFPIEVADKKRFVSHEQVLAEQKMNGKINYPYQSANLYDIMPPDVYRVNLVGNPSFYGGMSQPVAHRNTGILDLEDSDFINWREQTDQLGDTDAGYLSNALHAPPKGGLDKRLKRYNTTAPQYVQLNRPLSKRQLAARTAAGEVRFLNLPEYPNSSQYEQLRSDAEARRSEEVKQRMARTQTLKAEFYNIGEAAFSAKYEGLGLEDVINDASINVPTPQNLPKGPRRGESIGGPAPPSRYTGPRPSEAFISSTRMARAEALGEAGDGAENEDMRGDYVDHYPYEEDTVKEKERHGDIVGDASSGTVDVGSTGEWGHAGWEAWNKKMVERHKSKKLGSSVAMNYQNQFNQYYGGKDQLWSDRIVIDPPDIIEDEIRVRGTRDSTALTKILQDFYLHESGQSGQPFVGKRWFIHKIMQDDPYQMGSEINVCLGEFLNIVALSGKKTKEEHLTMLNSHRDTYIERVQSLFNNGSIDELPFDPNAKEVRDKQAQNVWPVLRNMIENFFNDIVTEQGAMYLSVIEQTAGMSADQSSRPPPRPNFVTEEQKQDRFDSSEVNTEDAGVYGVRTTENNSMENPLTQRGSVDGGIQKESYISTPSPKKRGGESVVAMDPKTPEARSYTSATEVKDARYQIVENRDQYFQLGRQKQGQQLKQQQLRMMYETSFSQTGSPKKLTARQQSTVNATRNSLKSKSLDIGEFKRLEESILENYFNTKKK